MIKLNQKPTDELVQQFMKQNRIDKKVLALQYFDKKCYMCGNEICEKSTIGMNLKFYGRMINKFLCKDCFIKKLNWNEREYTKRLNGLKNNCNLL